MCSAYLGVVGSSANYHCHLCNGTKINKSSKKLPKFVCPKNVAKNSIKRDNDLNISQFQWEFFISFEETTNINITGLQQSSKKLCGNGEVFNIITSQCKKFSCSKGYKKYGSGCFEDNNILKNTTRTDCNTTLNRCLIETNISLIFVTSPSRENKFTPDENLKVLLNTTLHFAKIDLETPKNNSCYQTNLHIKPDHSKRIQSTLTNRGSFIWKAIGNFFVLHLPSKDF